MQYRVGQVAIEQLNPQDGERILEIGCGPGRLTALIAQKIPNGEVVATDISQNMIEKAGEMMTQSGLTNVQFACIDAGNIQFGNEFDAIFSNFAAMWAFQPRRLYKKLYKALRPSGRILITVPAQNADIKLKPSSGTELDIINGANIIGSDLSAIAMQKQLEWARFTSISLETQVFDWHIDEMIAVSEAAPGFSHQGNREKVREYLLAYAKSMGIEQTGENGVIPFPVLFVNAKKGT